MDTKPLFIAARYKYLLVLPFLLIIPVTLAMSWMSRTTEYVSVSRVLVQSQRYTPGEENNGCNPYISLSQCVSGAMNTLLSTDQFSAEVAEEAGLPTATDAERTNSIWTVRTGTTVYSGGEGLVVISHASENGADAQRITAALVTAYDARYIEIYQRDADRAQAFYQAQLANDERALADANSAVSERVGELAPAAIATDVEYRRLLDELNVASRNVQETEDRISEINADVQAVVDGRQDAFNVVDEASLGSPVTTGLKKLMIYPIAGFLLAISIAAGLFAFLVKTDRSVRVPEDLSAIPGLTVLGTMPDVSHTKRRDWPKNFFRLAITTFGMPDRPVRTDN